MRGECDPSYTRGKAKIAIVKIARVPARFYDIAGVDDQVAAHRKLVQRRDDVCVDAPRKRALPVFLKRCRGH